MHDVAHVDIHLLHVAGDFGHHFDFLERDELAGDGETADDVGARDPDDGNRGQFRRCGR